MILGKCVVTIKYGKKIVKKKCSPEEVAVIIQKLPVEERLEIIKRLEALMKAKKQVLTGDYKR